MPFSVRGVARAVAIVVAAVAVCAPSARASFPGGNARVAYSQGGAIWTSEPDGTAPTRVVALATQSDHYSPDGPAFSPDGTKLAYVDGGQLKVVAAQAGATPTVVAPGPYFSPTWSPDGSRVAVIDGSSNLVVVQVSTGAVLATFPPPTGEGYLSPTWRPTTSGIDIAAQTIRLQPGENTSELVRVDASGTVTALTTRTDFERYGQLDWSPDGQRLAFRDPCTTGCPQPGTRELVTIPAGGGPVTVVDPSVATGSGVAFSPDGRHITYVTDESAGTVAVANADGTGKVTHTTAVGQHSTLSWGRTQLAAAIAVTTPDGSPAVGATTRPGATLVATVTLRLDASASGPVTMLRADPALAVTPTGRLEADGAPTPTPPDGTATLAPGASTSYAQRFTVTGGGVATLSVAASGQGPGGAPVTTSAQLDVDLGLSLDAQDATVSEPASGSVQVPVAVTLTQPSAGPVTVRYATQDDSATSAHGDYAPTSGTLTFPAGATSEAFDVRVNATGLTGEHAFGVVLTDAAGATIGRGRSSVTITDRPTLVGTVEARPGRGLPGVAVSVTGPDGTRTVPTDALGAYSIALDPGDYTVTALPGDGRFVPQPHSGCTPSGAACQVTLATAGARRADFVAALSVDAVELRQPSVTSGALEPVPAAGTHDGNRVEIGATLTNSGDRALTTSVAYGRPALAGDATALPMPGVSGAPSSVVVPAGGSVVVKAQWDTSGTAWTDDGRPDPSHVVRATLGLVPSYGQATVTVRPKPVVLVHGLMSDSSDWAAYVGPLGFLHRANPLWEGFAVDDGQVPGRMDTNPFDPKANSILDNAAEEKRYIEGVRRATDSWHVDVVAHSMGGLISRRYIDGLMPPDPPDGKPVVSHLAMLGTPNEGSPCAYDSGAVLVLTGRRLRGNGLPNDELRPDVVAAFNRVVTNRRGVPFSILAGRSVPVTCGHPGASDQVVPVPSALWTIADNATVTGLLHTDMTSSLASFSGWIRPHLALGPAAASGSRARTAPALRQTRRAVSRAVPSSPTASKPVCKATSGGVSGLAAGGVATLARGQRVVALRVARGDRLTLVLLHEPGLDATLVGPDGRTRGRITADSAAGRAPYSALEVKRPAAGRWRLRLRSQSKRLDVAYSLTEQGSAVRLRVSRSTSRGKLTGLGARLTVAGRARSHAKLVVLAGTPGHAPRHLRMAAVPGHPGRYAVRLPKQLLRSPTLSAVVTAAGPGVATSTFVATTGCR